MTIPANEEPVAETTATEPDIEVAGDTDTEVQQQPTKLPVPSAPPATDDSSFAPEQLSFAPEQQQAFPPYFFDPKTRMIMMNPVVDSNGDSIEKPIEAPDVTAAAAAADSTTPPTYYPNRALRSIIQRETQRNSNSFIGSLRRLDDSARRGWNQMLDKSAIGTEYRPLPDSFYCPITCDLMTDPVVVPDGNTFERTAIVNWIRANHTNPITRQPLTIAELRRNNNLYQMIQAEKNRIDPDARHPSIRRWIADGATETSRPVLSAADLEDTAAADADVLTPLNYAQIAAARRRRQQSDRSWTAVFVFTVIVILLFVPANSAFLVLLVALMLLTCCKSAQQQRQEQQLLAQVREREEEEENTTTTNNNNGE